MFESQLFKNKTALVTGGGSGIGFAIARQLLQLGATVYIASRKEEKLAAAAAELATFGPVQYAVCDIRKTDQIRALGEKIGAEAGRLDILINNAGGQFPSLASDLSENGWLAVINNNLNGTWFMTQEMAKRFFLPQQQGCIVNIILNIYRGFPGMAHSAAARAGVDNLTKSLAVEWARKGVRINAIAPGIIRSSGFDQYPDSLTQGIAEKIPMHRLGTVDEVAALCTFLCAPLAGYITGETVYIDGGHRLWGDVFPLEQ